jgi:DNA-binding MarR family transcriptional regulator
MPKPTKARTTKPPRARVPLDVGPLNDFVGYRLRRAQLAVYDDFVKGQGTAPLTPGLVGVLVLIDRNPDITQQQLCEGIGIDKSTLVVTLHRLTDRGLIKRVRSTEDRRQNGLRLTAKGVSKLRSTLSYVRQHERKITAQLSAAESKLLVELLNKVSFSARRGSKP